LKPNNNELLKCPQKMTNDYRFIYLDNIKILLTILVVTTHLAITYGPAGPWVYYERTSDLISNFILTMFFSINLAFLMGCFLIFSGYFVAGSYDRKGPLLFLFSRCIRLGIPGLFYYLFLSPTVIYIEEFLINKKISVSYWTFLSDSLLHFDNLETGPIWFVFTLLFFSITYTLIRLILRPFRKNLDYYLEKEKPLGNGSIFIFSLIITLVIVIIRLTKPHNLSFTVKISYLLKYIGFFALGIIAYRRKWFQNLNVLTVKIWSYITIVALLIWPIMYISGGGLNTPLKEYFKGPRLGSLTPFFGGMNWQTICYSVWETFFSVGACVCLLYLFEKRFNYQGKLIKAMSLSAYSVYLIHTRS
jgi:glucan biosynthesis protein C